MRICVFGLTTIGSLLISSTAFAQACPNGVVDVPRGKGAVISINRSGPESSALTVEWQRDGNGYYTRDSAQEVVPEQNKQLDYTPAGAANFAPKANSELQVRVTGSVKDGGSAKCMGEAVVQRFGDHAEVRFGVAKGGAPNTVVSVTYKSP